MNADRRRLAPLARRLLCHHKTGGIGVQRIDMDERYACIATETDGHVGNILVIHDIRDPRARGDVAVRSAPGP